MHGSWPRRRFNERPRLDIPRYDRSVESSRRRSRRSPRFGKGESDAPSQPRPTETMRLQPQGLAEVFPQLVSELQAERRTPIPPVARSRGWPAHRRQDRSGRGGRTDSDRDSERHLPHGTSTRDCCRAGAHIQSVRGHVEGAAGAQLVKEIPRARRFESDDDEQKLLDAAVPHLRAVIIALLDTACRLGELLSLQWRDVNLERRELTIRALNAKTREARILPLSSRLL